MSTFSTTYRIGEELMVPARELLNLPEHVHPRTTYLPGDLTWVPDGPPPIITRVWSEPGEDGEDYVWVATTADMPGNDLSGPYRFAPDDRVPVVYNRTNPAQEAALYDRSRRYNVLYDYNGFRPTFDLPKGYVAGWIGDRIYVGCDPEGRISS